MTTKIVYRFFNKINQKSYFGKGNLSRVQEHLGEARRIRAKQNTQRYIHKSRSNNLLDFAIAKYGSDCFEVTIMFANLSEDDANMIECFYIRKFKTNVHKYGFEFGYNQTDGCEGTSGHSMSKEAKEKISKTLKGKNTWSKGLKVDPNVVKKIRASNTGKKRSDHSRQNISDSLMGKKKSESHRKNMSKARAGMTAWNKGIVCSEQTKLKISQSKTGIPSGRAGQRSEKCARAISEMQDILQRISNGEKRAAIAQEYDISYSAFCSFVSNAIRLDRE